jgi:hypothetical protein
MHYPNTFNGGPSLLSQPRVILGPALQCCNWFVERITRIVLDRLSGPRPSQSQQG